MLFCSACRFALLTHYEQEHSATQLACSVSNTYNLLMPPSCLMVGFLAVTATATNWHLSAICSYLLITTHRSIAQSSARCRLASQTCIVLSRHSLFTSPAGPGYISFWMPSGLFLTNCKQRPCIECWSRPPFFTDIVDFRSGLGSSLHAVHCCPRFHISVCRTDRRSDFLFVNFFPVASTMRNPNFLLPPTKELRQL